MQKFLIVNTKGFTPEQAIVNMHSQLEKINADPATDKMQIHSVNFVNSFEKPQKSALDLNGTGNQPVVVYNCCVMLVGKK